MTCIYGIHILQLTAKRQPETVRKGNQILSHSYLVCVEVLQPSQPIGVMLRAVSLHNNTFTGQA